MKTQAVAVLILLWSGAVTNSWSSEPIQVQTSLPSLVEIKRDVFSMKNSNIDKAKSLRGMLRSTFDHLKATGGLSGRISGTDITDVVHQYINTGISFIDAEEILKDAGFEINYPDLVNEPNNINKAVDWYAIIAEISPYATQEYSKNSIFITLLPGRPGEYNKITKRLSRNVSGMIA